MVHKNYDGVLCLKRRLYLVLLLVLSVAAAAKPSIGLVADYDFVIGDWLASEGAFYLPLSVSDLPFLLDHLDVVIINDAGKLDDITVDSLKKFS
jgi:hypothetical protein